MLPMTTSKSREISSEGMAAWASFRLLMSAFKMRVCDSSRDAHQHRADLLLAVGNHGVVLVVLAVMFLRLFLGLGRRRGLCVFLGLCRGVFLAFVIVLRPRLVVVLLQGRSYLAGVAADAVKAFDVDEQGVVVGRAGGLQDAHHGEGPVLVVALGAGLMRGPERVAQFQPELPGRGGAGHAVEVVVPAEVVALGEFVDLDVFLVAVLVRQFEHIRRGADHTLVLIGIAQADWHRHPHLAQGDVFTTVQLLVNAVGQRGDRLADIEHVGEHQVQVAALGRTDDQVVALAATVEGLLHDAIDHQHGNHEHHAQGHGDGRQQRGQRPLLNATPGDFPETHSG